jgi:hypothetical protein
MFSWKHKCGTYSHQLDDIRRRHIWLLLPLPQQLFAAAAAATPFFKLVGEEILLQLTFKP